MGNETSHSRKWETEVLRFSPLVSFYPALCSFNLSNDCHSCFRLFDTYGFLVHRFFSFFSRVTISSDDKLCVAIYRKAEVGATAIGDIAPLPG